MPAPSETRRNRVGLPVVGLAAARELFRRAESSGLGRPGTDEIFDRWLDNRCDIGFYRAADRPLQARAVDVDDEVPETLSNSRTGQARLEAVCLNPSQPDYFSTPSSEPSCADADDEDFEEIEEFEETDEDEDTDAHSCFSGMPGLCWGEIPKGYAKVDSHQDHQDCDAEGCVLQLVHAYPGGVAQDPYWDLSDELPPDFDGRSLRGLTVLIETARRKLDTQGWDTDGPWRLRWTSCAHDVTNRLGEPEDAEVTGAGPDGGLSKSRYHVSVRNDGDAHPIKVVRTRGGYEQVVYQASVPEPDGDPQNTETLEGLQCLLQRATEQVGEAGYEMDGEWTLGWSRCYALLDRHL